MTFDDQLLAPLIDNEQALIAMLMENFDRRYQDVVKTAVSIHDLPTIARLENVGFQTGRQFSKGKHRMLRMNLDRYDFVRMLAETKMAEFIDMNEWSFAFDSAKRRAGLCNYTDKVISISRYMVDIHTMDETLQVVLHEVAHAISGKAAGHTKKWLATAKQIGYRAEEFTGTEIAAETATWIGRCPAGHTHYRYRRPARMLSCAVCAPGFDQRNLIRWRHRDETLPNYGVPNN
jgi:predicted SprT family Zn-dependent metalloprotease